jgi:hypothetical protein
MLNKSIHEQQELEGMGWYASVQKAAAGMDCVKVVANVSGKAIARDDLLVVVDRVALPG